MASENIFHECVEFGNPEVVQKRASGKLAVEAISEPASVVAQKPFLPVGRKSLILQG
jgi:hypothetical protein